MLISNQVNCHCIVCALCLEAPRTIYSVCLEQFLLNGRVQCPQDVSANQSVPHSVQTVLYWVVGAQDEHTATKKNKKGLVRLCSHLNVLILRKWILDVISSSAAKEKKCLQQAELLKTSTLHAIPVFFFWPAPTSKQASRCQLDCSSGGGVAREYMCVYMWVLESGRFGLRPGPWHICADKHIFTYIFFSRCCDIYPGVESVGVCRQTV